MPVVILWRALRGLPLATEGDSPQHQRLAKFVTARVYNALSRWLDRGETEFMNYGYRAPDDQTAHADGDDFGISLYRRVAAAADLRDGDVLEVGSGRGGGAAFVARERQPRTMVGVDLSAAAIAHSRAAHRQPNLRFVEGDAESLPFPAGSFDAVINVESSHGYPSMHRFLCEVHRVLRPEGVMLFADVRSPADLAGLGDQFRGAGFAILEDERLTPGVVRALELDGARRRRMVSSLPGPLRQVAGNFVGAQNGEIFGSLQDGRLEYVRFALRREPSLSAADPAQPR